MNRKSFIYKTYFGASLLFLVFTVAMRCVACFIDLNYQNGYFEDKLLINIANYTLIFAVVFALSYAFAEKRDKNFIFNFSSPLNYVFAGTLGIALLFTSRHAFELFRSYKLYVDINLSNPFVKTGTEKLLSYLCLALGILALLSVAHFILASLIVKEKDTRRADFGLITVIFFSLYATFLYFSTDMPINVPAKVVDQCAYLTSALFFLFETRISIGRERWRAYRAFGLVAMLLTAYSAIPSLLVYIVDGAAISNSIYETALTLAISLFIGARLVLTSQLREKEEAKTVILIKNAFASRVDEINPKDDGEYDPETDEELQGIVVEDRGDYYELNFEEGADASEEENGESEESLSDEENSGN